ncbi:MAG TPA: helix-turn-helix domain-containing protein [Roseomonas sp.]
MSETKLETVTRWGKVPAWWLLHEGIDADRFCVLAAMATYADDAGLCDPSQATLARRLKRSRPWVNRVVAQLADEGFLEKTVRARRNGGTTSCLYRLHLLPPERGVAAVTEGVGGTDSPRHRPDTSQPEAEQIQDSRPDARAAGDGKPTVAAAGGRPPGEDRREPERDWTPSDDAVAEAVRLYPDADLDEHTARFVARCRAKGYQYARLDDAWLDWLLADRRGDRRAASRTAAAPPAAMPARAANPAELRAGRFNAWAAAAEAPAVHAWS